MPVSVLQVENSVAHMRLPSGHIFLIDEVDVEMVMNYGSWFLVKSPQKHHTLLYVRSSKKIVNGISAGVFLHRFILGVRTGMVIDHIDGSGLNNTRSNLRFCTSAENRQNCRSASALGYLGVSKARNRFIASIRVKGKKTKTRTFATPEEAARAYDEMAIRFYGQHAGVNFRTKMESPSKT